MELWGGSSERGSLLGLSSSPESPGGQLWKLLPYDLQVNTRICYPLGKLGCVPEIYRQQAGGRETGFPPQ